MSEKQPDILIVRDRIATEQLICRVEAFFGDMVKLVVDLEAGVLGLGGELHADAEEILLEAGSRQENLWGANYYPGRGPTECLEYTSLINIRPARGNPSMEVQDPAIRDRIRELVHALIGTGEEEGWPRSTAP